MIVEFIVFHVRLSLYVGKTTTKFNQRFNEHFHNPELLRSLNTQIQCSIGKQKTDFSVQYLESMYSRGKYTLSEKEYLWNEHV